MKNNVTIIAEAGVNHNGNINNARKLINAAAEAGADYVKFQTFKTELNLTKSAKKAGYQEETTGTEESQYEMIKKLELSFEDFLSLKKYCDKKGIGFLSTGFDFPSLDFLESLSPDFYKIPSGEITNLPYLRKIAGFHRPIVMSTGMANIEEIKDAYNVLIKAGLKSSDITIVHCNTEYPTPMEDVNLKAMNDIGEKIGTKIGYSDHTLGIEVPIAAVALGATVIEKHFTLDKTLPGNDHYHAMDPDDLKLFVDNIELLHKISGQYYKEPLECEKESRKQARRSIVAKVSMKKNEILTREKVTFKRPGTGISPADLDKVLGRKVAKNIPEDELISWDEV